MSCIFFFPREIINNQYIFRRCQSRNENPKLSALHMKLKSEFLSRNQGAFRGKFTRSREKSRVVRWWQKRPRNGSARTKTNFLVLRVLFPLSLGLRTLANSAPCLEFWVMTGLKSCVAAVSLQSRALYALSTSRRERAREERETQPGPSADEKMPQECQRVPARDVGKSPQKFTRHVADNISLV